MSVITIEVEGLEQVQRALAVAPQIAAPEIEKAVGRSLIAIYGKAGPYPPQPPRDRAESFNTYMRGIGHFPRSSFVGAKRKARGAYAAGPRGGQVRRTSEDLGQKAAHKTFFSGYMATTRGQWKTKGRVTAQGFLGILGNTASYADYVQGEKQASYHAQTGWVKLSDAARQVTTQIQQLFNNAAMAIAKALRRAMM